MKMGVSHDACELCAAGFFQNETAQSVCLACGVFSTSAPGREFCECDAGHTSSHPGVLVSAPVCEPCAADTYKEALGPAACDACGTFMRSPAAAVLQTQCLCDEGYFFTGLYDTCAECAAGTFKATVSNGDPAIDCVACPAASFSSAASNSVNDCSCNAGFTPSEDHDGCDHCDAGYFKGAQDPSCASRVPRGLSTHTSTRPSVWTATPARTRPRRASSWGRVCVRPASSLTRRPLRVMHAQPARSTAKRAGSVPPAPTAPSLHLKRARCAACARRGRPRTPRRARFASATRATTHCRCVRPTVRASAAGRALPTF